MTPEQLLGAARRRLRGIIAGRAVVRLAWVAALCTLAGVLTARWVAWQPIELLALLVPVVVLAAWVAWAATRPMPEAAVAHVADHGLGSHDALAAYLEFAEGSPQFSERISERASRVAGSAELKRAVPASLIGPRHEVGRYLGVAGLAVLCAAGLAFLDNPQDSAREQRRRETAAVERAQDDLEAAADKLGDDAAAADKLNALAQDLDGLDAAAATEALADAEAKLQTDAGANLDSALAATAGLDASLAARPLPGAQKPGDGAPPGETPSDAAGRLAESAGSLASLNADQKAELAKRLEDLAATQAAGAPEVAEAMKAAEEAVKADDPGAAATLEAAAAAQAAQAKSVGQRGEARQAAGATGAARADVASAANPSANSGDARAQAAPGEDQGKGQGQGKGKGQGQGKGGAGKGAGADGSPSGTVGAGKRNGGGSGKGGKGRPGDAGQGLGTDANKVEATVSDVFAPEPSGSSDAEGAQQGNGGDLDQDVGKGQAPSQRGAARLPLSDAVARYNDAATRALDDPQLPPASRQVMADYFEQLSGSPTIPSN